MGHQRAPSIRNSHGSTSIRPPAPTSRLPEAKLNQVMDAFVGILVAESMLNSTRGLRLIRHLFPHSISLLIKLGKRSRTLTLSMVSMPEFRLMLPSYVKSQALPERKRVRRVS